MTRITAPMIDELLTQVGGRANIARCGHCMTRLRLTLHDPARANRAALKQIPGVLGVIENEDQLQIVLGPGHARTACELVQAKLNANTASDTDAPTADLHTVTAANKQRLQSRRNGAIQHFLSRFATIFTPLIPGFIAAGLLLGIATLLEQTLAPQPATQPGLIVVIHYLKVFSKGLFTFLPILIGFNTQRVFGGTGVNGAIISALFLLRYQAEGAGGDYAGFDHFLGLAIQPHGTIIGVLLAGMLGAFIEQQIRRVMPASVEMLLTATLTLLITGFLTYTVIMPLGGWLFNGMSWLFLHLNGNPLGTALLAGLFLIAVVFGIHQGFVPVYFALIEQQGFNSLFPVLAMAGAGQVGAALALYLKAAPQTALRDQIKGALFPALLGIGEPLIYGVTLPRMKPFITACLGGAVGGFFIGFVASLGLPIGLNTVFGPSGLVAVPLMTSASGIFAGMGIYCAGTVIAWLAGFLLTWGFGGQAVDLR